MVDFDRAPRSRPTGRGPVFVVWVPGEFQRVAALGVATATTLVEALAADLSLLPALLAAMGFRVCDSAGACTAPVASARQGGPRDTTPDVAFSDISSFTNEISLEYRSIVITR